MKYQAPYGSSDGNAGYINGNPSTGVQGSIPPAASIEEPQREIVNTLTDAGLTPTDADLHQLAKAIQSNALNYAIDTGTQNAMVVALVPGLPAATPYTPGLIVRAKVLHANIHDTTHTTLTLDAGGGPANVKRSDGSIPLSNDLPAGMVATFVFDGTNFQIANFLGTGTGGGGSSTFITKIPYVVDSSVTANLITAIFSPAIVALAVGDVIMVKLATTNTGATNIAVNALGNFAVVRNDGSNTAVKANDLQTGTISFMIFDGTRFLLLNPRYLGGVPSAIVTFTSSGTFVVPNGVYRVRAKVWAAGAGGGGNAVGRVGAGGGGGGGYSERICAVSPGLSVPVTVGAGGAGTTWGSSPANAGGSSSFGGFCSATGGSGGYDDSYVLGPLGGGPGVGSGGDVNRGGGYGTAPIGGSNGGAGGDGAGGGGQGGGPSTGGPSNTAQAPGGGGEGCPAGYALAGANGARGEVVVEY